MYGDWPLKRNQRHTANASKSFGRESSEGKTVKHRWWTVACSFDIDFAIKRGNCTFSTGTYVHDFSSSTCHVVHVARSV